MIPPLISYQNGLLNGGYKVVMQEGSIQDLGFYKNNNLQGQYTLFNYKDTPIYSYTYEDGRKIGNFKTWETKGSYNADGYYDGPFEGKVRDGYLAKGVYENGKRIGVWWFTHSVNSYKFTFVNDTLNGDYEIYETKGTEPNSVLNLIEKGSLINMYLDGFRYTYRYPNLDGKKSSQIVANKAEFSNGISVGEHLKYNYLGGVQEKIMYDSLGQMKTRETWNTNGDLMEEHFYIDGSASGTSYWSNGMVRNRYVSGRDLSNQYDFDYDTSGQLIGRDTFYHRNGKRYYDGYSYKNGKVTFENHIVDAKRVGRWFYEGEWDGFYKNEKFVGKCNYIWQLERNEIGNHYFEELSYPGDMKSSGYKSSSKFQNIGAANYSIHQSIDSSERRFENLTSEKSRNEIVELIKKYDTLNQKGEVVFKCYINSNGRICSPTLIKGLSSYYNEYILWYLLWKSVNAEQGIKPAWIELKYTF